MQCGESALSGLINTGSTLVARLKKVPKMATVTASTCISHLGTLVYRTWDTGEEVRLHFLDVCIGSLKRRTRFSVCVKRETRKRRTRSLWPLISADSPTSFCTFGRRLTWLSSATL